MAMITCVVSWACMVLTAVTTTFKWKLQSAASSLGNNRALSEKKLKNLSVIVQPIYPFALFYSHFSP